MVFDIFLICHISLEIINRAFEEISLGFFMKNKFKIITNIPSYNISSCSDNKVVDTFEAEDILHMDMAAAFAGKLKLFKNNKKLKKFQFI